MHCCICDAALSGTSWVCDECAKDYSLTGPVSTWPAWAKELYVDEQRQRRCRKRENGLVVSVGIFDGTYPHEHGLGTAWSYLISDMGIDNPDYGSDAH
jgi:hypothetical protein